MRLRLALVALAAVGTGCSPTSVVHLGQDTPKELSAFGSPHVSGTVFLAQGGGIWRLRGGSINRLTGATANLAYPAASANGAVTAVAMVESGHAEIALGDHDFTNLTPLTRIPRDSADWTINVKPAISPDGKRLGFISDRCYFTGCALRPDQTLYENAIGLAARRVSTPPGYSGGEDFPAYTPDGTGLTYVSWREGQTVVKRLTIPGTVEHRLFIPTVGDALDPMVGPDGRIAYARRKSGVTDIAISSIDGEAEVVITSFGDCRQPSWSADGKSLLFISQHGGSFDLWKVPVAGGTPERITWGADLDTNSRPVWIAA